MSEKQLLANQQNSKLSTGPRSETGKQAVSINAIKHGIYSNKIMQLAAENEDFKDLQNSINESYQPASPVESILVSIIVENTWRLNLISKTEQGLYKKKELEDTIIKCKEIILCETKSKGGSAEMVYNVIMAYLGEPENPYFIENTALTDNIEKLMMAEKEADAEAMKLAKAFHFDSISSETFTKLARYRKGTEHSLYLAIDKLSNIQRDRIYKDLLVAKSVSIKDMDNH